MEVEATNPAGDQPTADEWEGRLGQQIRNERFRQQVTQSDLARLANIDRTTVARIERGEGGSVRSLVQIARALGREAWFDTFAQPVPTVSPMQLLRERQAEEARQRKRVRPGARQKAPS